MRLAFIKIEENVIVGVKPFEYPKEFTLKKIHEAFYQEALKLKDYLSDEDLEEIGEDIFDITEDSFIGDSDLIYGFGAIDEHGVNISISLIKC